jgi:hypothetical protein
MDRKSVGSRLVEVGLPSEALLTFSDGNPSLNLPYHNNDHCYNVAVDAYELGKMFPQINVRSLRHLLVAGLFHDYAHTGYSHPDNLNIAAAVQFVKQIGSDLKSMDINVGRIIRLIRATENPSPPTREYSLDEKIMRDADLMGWCQEENHEKFLLGLSIEFEEPVTRESTKRFLSSTKFYTNHAVEKFKEAGWLEK